LRIGTTGGCAINRTSTCSGNCTCTPVTASAQAGAIVLTDGPGNYGKDWNCVFVVTATDRISTLKFTSWETRPWADYIRLRKCTTAACTSFIEFFHASFLTTLATIYSSDADYPFLQLIFTSYRFTVVRDGFTANWNVGAPLATCVTPPCLAGEYMIPHECKKCPANSNSVAQSTNIAACTCNAGWSGPAGGPCVALCAAGSYVGVLTNSGSTCVDCVANSLSPEGSTAVTECICNAAWPGPPGGPCGYLCTAGTYHDPLFGNGWIGEYYAYSTEMMSSDYVGFDALTPAFTTHTLTINYPGRDYWPYAPQQFGVRWRGMVNIVTAGNYDFRLWSADAAWLWVNEEMIVNNGDVTSTTWYYGQVTLPVGIHYVRVHYFEKEGNAVVIVRYTGPGISEYTVVVEAFSVSCTSCPANSLSPASSMAITACICNAGSNGPNGGTCTQCSSGTYKTDTGNSGCLGCPTNSLSPAGSTAAGACICNAGWNSPNGGSCVLCTGGTYKGSTGNTGCVGCPANSLSPAGSTVITACVCNTGWFGPNGGHCGKCGPDTYLGTAINFARACASTQNMPCPATLTHSFPTPAPNANDGNINTMVLSSGSQTNYFTIDFGRIRRIQNIKFYNRLDCCGSWANGVQVRVGNYAGHEHSLNPICATLNSENVQTHPCTGMGQYISFSKADDFINFMEFEAYGECLGCPENSVSPHSSSAITACQCNAGFTGPNGGPCTQCGLHHYKAGLGPGSCVSCPAGFHSSAGSTNLAACVQCSAGTYFGTSNNLARACKIAEHSNCPVAASLFDDTWTTNGNDGNIDTTLEVYKRGSNTEIMYRIDFGQTRSLERIRFYNRINFRRDRAIGAQIWVGSNEIGSSNTQCATLNSDYEQTHICKLSGRYIFILQSLSETLNFMELEAYGTCVNCPANSRSPFASPTVAACECNAGYFRRDVYAVTVGGATCSSSWQGSYNETALVHNGFPVYEYSGLIPYYLFQTPTAWIITWNLQAPTPKFEATSTAGVASLGSLSWSERCTTWSWDGSVVVSYVVGSAIFTPFVAGTTCAPCASGSYKSAVGSMGCSPCPANSGSPAASTAIGACFCNAGWNGPDGSTCIQCLAGTYKPGTGNSGCVACPTSSVSPAGSIINTACQCNAGFSGANGTTCTQCLAGTYKAGLGPGLCEACLPNSVSAAGSIIITACQCNAGYTGADGDTCSQCLADTYKAELGPGLCIACHPNSVSAAGSIFDTACQCNAGFSGANGAACSQCLAGTYKAGLGPTCTNCPANSVSAAGSIIDTACQCNAGFSGANGTTCTQCLAGTYKAGLGAICTPCLPNSVSPAGSIVDTACQCNAGFSGADGATCTQCLAGTYKAGLGPGLCEACLPNSVSAAGSIIITACQCNAGYTGADGDTCSQCLADTYKAELGPGLCIACHPNSVSAAGSIFDTACQCNAGFSGANGTTCTQCLAGTYKAGLGPGLCEACRANSDSAAGSINITACRCNAGYGGTTLCEACPLGTHRPAPDSGA